MSHEKEQDTDIMKKDLAESLRLELEPELND
jgi:hypothetical protein